VEQYLLAFAIALLLLVMASLYRGIFGPTIFDRILGVGVVGTKTVVVLVVVGLLYGRVDLFIDCAITYALLNFLGVLVASKFFIHRGLEEGR
jgi:multicomponent Na+:H+ antiporter subunit F